MTTTDAAIDRLRWMHSHANQVMTVALIASTVAVLTALIGALLQSTAVLYPAVLAGSVAFGVYLHANAVYHQIKDLDAILRGTADTNGVPR